MPDVSLNRLYNMADVGLNTSMGRSSVNSALEMAACGLPQIMTECGAGHEFFKPIAWMLDVQKSVVPGFCAEGGLTTPMEVRAALLDAYEHPEKGAAFAKAALEEVQRRKYRWGHMAGRFEKLVRSL